MTGTHYILDRDRKNPIDLVKEKACRTCQVVKPNDFKHFCKKLWRTRAEYTTSEVCLNCKGEAMRRTHAARREADHQWNELQIQKQIELFKRGAAERAARESAEAAARGSEVHEVVEAALDVGRANPDEIPGALNEDPGRNKSDPG